jgi:hypothetical protein
MAGNPRRQGTVRIMSLPLTLQEDLRLGAMDSQNHLIGALSPIPITIAWMITVCHRRRQVMLHSLQRKK